MKKSLILGVALGLAALTGLGMADVTQAQQRDRDDNREWHNDDREWRDQDGNRGSGNRAREFVGTWRLEQRGNGQGWNGGIRSLFAGLPQVIRIERDRRELRVENTNGRLLREIALRGNDARDGRIQVVTTSNGARVVETYTLRRGGRELVVQTTVHDRRGAPRQFTSIYDRA